MTEMCRFQARLLDLHRYAEITREMIRIEVDKGGVPLMAPKGIVRNILVEQVPTRAANIIKQEILARGGDLATPWMAAEFASETVDVIMTGNLVTLRSTIAKLYRQTVYHLREFADAVQDVLIKTTPGYLPVAREAKRQGVVVEETIDDLYGGRIPLGTGGRARGVPSLVPPCGCPDWDWQWGRRTYLMGVLNLAAATPGPCDRDDGVSAAVARGRQLVAAGADVIGIGGESAELWDDRTSATQAEISQVVPVIRRLRQESPQVLIAVDTWKSAVAAAALEAGAHLINDVSAMRRDPVMRDVAAQYKAPIVVMHGQDSAIYQDLMSDIARSFWSVLDEAAQAGVQAEQVILNAGWGFGKSLQQDLECTRRLRELTSFGRPLLHAPSRGPTADRMPDAGGADDPLGVAAAVTVGIANGADLVRVHDVAATVDAVKVWRAIELGDFL